MSAPPISRDQIRADALRTGREYVNSALAAAYLDITDPTLRKWRVRRYGPRFQKIGGEVRYYFSDLDAWFEQQFVGGDS